MCKDCGCGHTHNDVATISVEGMTCGHCTESVEKALLGLHGVVSAAANLEAKNVVVDYDGHKVSIEALKSAIEDIGFDVNGEIQVQKHSHGIGAVIKKLFN